MAAARNNRKPGPPQKSMKINTEGLREEEANLVKEYDKIYKKAPWRWGRGYAVEFLISCIPVWVLIGWLVVAAALRTLTIGAVIISAVVIIVVVKLYKVIVIEPTNTDVSTETIMELLTQEKAAATEQGSMSFSVSKSLTADCASGKGVMGVWEFHYDVAGWHHKEMIGRYTCDTDKDNGEHIMTSVYGENGPSTANGFTMSTVFHTTEEMKEWWGWPIPENIKSHCTKLMLFPDITQKMFYMIPDNSDGKDISKAINAMCASIIHDIVMEKLKKSVENDQAIKNRDIEITTDDLTRYFDKAATESKPEIRERMDTVDEYIKQAMSRQSLTDTVLLKNDFLVSADELSELLRQIDNGEKDVVSVEKKTQVFVPDKSLCNTADCGKHAGVDGVITFTPFNDYAKIMTSVYGEDGPSWETSFESTIHFESKEEADQWMDLPPINSVKMTCVEITLFPGFTSKDEWKYLLPYSGNVDDLRKVFDTVCRRILHIILEKEIEKTLELKMVTSKERQEQIFHNMVPFFFNREKAEEYRKDGEGEDKEAMEQMDLLDGTVKAAYLSQQKNVTGLPLF